MVYKKIHWPWLVCQNGLSVGPSKEGSWFRCLVKGTVTGLQFRSPPRSEQVKKVTNNAPHIAVFLSPSHTSSWKKKKKIGRFYIGFWKKLPPNPYMLFS